MNKKTKLLGLTGSIGTGKTTVASILKRKSIPVINADEIAHEITRPGKSSYKKIIKIFGKAILKGNRQIDRKSLSSIVFQSKKQRKLLEKITHPEIINKIKKQINIYAKRRKKIVAIDAPLLFESKFDKYTDVNIVVIASRKLQISRAMKKFRLSKSEVLKRINSQMPIANKIKLSDYVIKNNSDINSLYIQINCILKNLM